jgi:hypothetical protein
VSDQEAQGGQPREPTEEELRAALEEQMRRITVKDVLLQTVVTLVNLSARKLGLAGEEDEKDMAQARMGIDAARALVPLLPAQEVAPVRDALDQLQLAYVRESGAPGGGGRRAEGEDEGKAASGSEKAADEAERAKARSKIWTPPGA